MENKFRIISKTGLWILLLAGLAACQSGLTSYQGKTVNVENRFDLLDGGQHKQSWQTRDLLIEFQYLREQRNLQISGLVRPQTHILNFNRLENLYLSVHFVDAAGKVLADETIVNAGYRIEIPEQLAFKTNLKIPADSTAIALSYRGRAFSGGGSGGGDDRSSGRTDWDFWQGP